MTASDAHGSNIPTRQQHHYDPSPQPHDSDAVKCMCITLRNDDIEQMESAGSSDVWADRLLRRNSSDPS